jgi:hypothetical protein
MRTMQTSEWDTVDVGQGWRDYVTDAQEMLLIGLLMSALPFPGGERWFGWPRQTQSGSSWRLGMVISGALGYSFRMQ